MDKENQFTSTGIKLLHHPVVIERLKAYRKGSPISLQLAPTSRCNLNCVFCSNVHREKHEDLPYHAVQRLLETMMRIGAKTVEWTGGGDPTQWQHIKDAILFASSLAYRQGFITNGVDLKKKVSQQALDKLTWVRISMNCLDYVDGIDIPDIKGTLGFSYVMNDKTTDEVFFRINKYVQKFKPSYVRIVPNCQVSEEEQIENNKKYSKMVSLWGDPYFYQEKVFAKPKECYWGYFKPFILHDGYVYACSSVVLNDDAGRKFHEKYRLCKMEDLYDKYVNEIEPVSSESCEHCVFCRQNDMIRYILNPDGMEAFV